MFETKENLELTSSNTATKSESSPSPSPSTIQQLTPTKSNTANSGQVCHHCGNPNFSTANNKRTKKAILNSIECEENPYNSQLLTDDTPFDEEEEFGPSAWDHHFV